MNQFVQFLTDLGFTDPQQTSRRDIVEIIVHDAVKAARKCLRQGRVKFQPFDKQTTRNSVVQEFYAIQDRVAVGRVRIESYKTYSVVHLENIE